MALAPRCRCRMVQSRALHLRCKVQLGASAPHLGACTILSPVARTYSSAGNWKCALQFEIRYIYSVSGWAEAHPGECDRHRASGSQAILRSATKPAATKNHMSQALGRQLCWKPLLITAPSQPAAPGGAVVSRIMTTGGCSARSAAKRRCRGAQLIVHLIRLKGYGEQLSPNQKSAV